MPLVKRTPQPQAAIPEGMVATAFTQTNAQPQPVSEVANTAKRFGGTHKAGDKASAADTTMSKADWAAKDRRISRQGLFQAALQSVGLLQLNTSNTLEDYLKLVEQVADRGVEYVNKEK
jgi:hypothetical protein